ncbi:MAG: uracil-DNA glycosylase [Verrucomicrobiales bacterium]|nr:uracil-DNA glycosylase [Verrucomicrobiales bacterium]
MGSAFTTLLEATLEHLSELRSRGVTCVEVDPATLRLLAHPRSAPPGGVATPAAPTSRPPGTVAAVPPLAFPRAAPAATPPPPVSSDGFAPAVPGAPTVPAPVLPAAVPGQSKAEALEALREPVLACRRCPHLVTSRTQVVFGVGNPEADLMFVGEAPGADEDRLGEPFVGLAGQLLTRIIQAMGLTRESVYIANILKCRPNLPPGTRGNRAPTPEEMDTCKPYVIRQIEIIQPRAIVALGATAVSGLLGMKVPMGSIRGRWQDFRGTPVMPTFHPSYLLRSEDGPDRGRAEKRKTWEDMLKVLEKLERPITDKMRGYFAKPPGGGVGA